MAKPDIKIAQGGEMIGASGELIRWKASNSIRLSVDTTDLSSAQSILNSAVEQISALIPHLHNLDHFSGDLENYYVVNVSVSQPRRQDDMPSGGSQSRLEAVPLDLEDDDEGDGEGGSDEGGGDGVH